MQLHHLYVKTTYAVDIFLEAWSVAVQLTCALSNALHGVSIQLHIPHAVGCNMLFVVMNRMSQLQWPVLSTLLA